jgi:hypothetical protein
MPKKLLNAQELVAELRMTGISVRTIAGLRRARKIPYVKLGYRTMFYDPDRVLAALSSREIKAVGQERLR